MTIFESRKTLRYLTVIALAIFMTMASGCVDVRKLDVTSVKVNSVSPEGFRAVKGSATVGISNKSGGFQVYDIEGTVRRGTQDLGRFAVEPVTVLARTEGQYPVKGRLSLSDNVSALELLSLIPKFNASEYKVDLSFKVKPKGGAAKKMKFEDIPAEQLIRMLRK